MNPVVEMTDTQINTKKKPNLPLPEKYALSGSEDSHQISLFMWAANPANREKWPELELLFAIPNGGSRHKAEASKLRAMGVKRGVPDTLLPVPRGQWHGLFIELKRPAIKTVGKKKRAGFVRPQQTEWLDKLRHQGYGCKVCIGWEDARDTIIAYLEWKVE